MLKRFVMVWVAGLLAVSIQAQTNLWQLAKDSAGVHRFSTLFTAQDVLHCLSTEADLEAAVKWCKTNGITHVFIEAFRDGYRADRQSLQRARDRFRAAGISASGCVTTTVLGKPSSGWGPQVCCYTDPGTQASLQSIFEYAAGVFDEVMIDDFFFCDCMCPECDAAREARRVKVGDKTYPVEGVTWSDYHRALMLHVSQDRVLAAARKVNPKVQLIIKYPQWYDMYQERGYDVGQQTAAFDRIWVGTETRDYTNAVHWGGTVQYEGCFLMRWLGEIGGQKCGGGWYDTLGTTPPYYIEQARQTILAGARESLLFCYGTLNPDAHAVFPGSIPWPTPTGQADITALRTNLPELLAVAREVQRRQPRGIPVYKPINSPGGADRRVFDYLGMIGLPLVPCHQFPTNAPAAIFPFQACADTNLAAELNAYLKTGRLALLTGALANVISSSADLQATNAVVVNLPQPPDYLLIQKQTTLDNFRASLLDALHISFRAPAQVALYLFSPNGWVIENFNNQPVAVVFNSQKLNVAARGWVCHWENDHDNPHGSR